MTGAAGRLGTTGAARLLGCLVRPSLPASSTWSGGEEEADPTQGHTFLPRPQTWKSDQIHSEAKVILAYVKREANPLEVLSFLL